MTFGLNDPIAEDAPSKGFGSDDPIVSESRPMTLAEDQLFSGDIQIESFPGYPLHGFGDDEIADKSASAMYYNKTYGVPPDQAYDLVGEFNRLHFGKDLPAATGWERIKRRYKNGKAEVQSMDLGYQVVLDLLQNPNAFEENFDQLNKTQGQISEDFWLERRGLLERLVGETAQVVPFSVEALKAAPIPAGVGGMIGAGIAFLAGQAGPQIGTPEEIVTIPAATAQGIKVGAALGAADRIRQLEAGGQMLSLMQMEDPFGNKIDPKIAVVASHMVGAINGAIEIGEWATLLTTFGIGTKVFEDAAGKITANLLVKGTLNEIVAKKILQFGGTLSAEVLQEVFQETSNIVADELAKEINNRSKGTDFTPITGADLKGRYIEITVKSAQAFPALLAPGTIFSGVMEAIAPQAVKEGVLPAERLAPEAPAEPEIPPISELRIEPTEVVAEPEIPPISELRVEPTEAPETVQEATQQFKAKVKATPEGEAVVSDERMAQIRQRAAQRRAERAAEAVIPAEPTVVAPETEIPLRLRTDAFNRVLDLIDAGRSTSAEITTQIEASQNRLDPDQKTFLRERFADAPSLQDQQVLNQLKIHEGPQRAVYEDNKGNKLVVGQVDKGKGLDRVVLTPEGDIESLGSGPVDTKRWTQIPIPEADLERPTGRLPGGRQAGGTILFSPEEWSEMLEALQFHLDKGVVAAKALTEELVADFGEEARQVAPELIKIVKPPKKRPKKVVKAEPAKPKKKKSKIARRIEKELKTEFEDAATFEGINMAAQAEKAEKLVEEDPEQADRIAMGEEDPPPGLKVGTVWTAVKLKAQEEGDVDTLREMAVVSSVPRTASEFGQEVKAFDPAAFGKVIGEDPVKSMQEVQASREKAFDKKKGKGEAKKSVKANAKQIKAATRKEAKVSKWEKFIRELEC